MSSESAAGCRRNRWPDRAGIRTGRELADGIELRDRCLELFKVQSRGGVPEVWLLGQKLLGPQA
jgi:hypothetical protein